MQVRMPLTHAVVSAHRHDKRSRPFRWDERDLRARFSFGQRDKQTCVNENESVATEGIQPSTLRLLNMLEISRRCKVTIERTRGQSLVRNIRT